jgi:predicted nucleic acid-binding protein
MGLGLIPLTAGSALIGRAMPSLCSLLAKARLIAPEILIAECANILWKKVHGKELSREEALLAARLLQGAALELLPIRSLLETATRIAIELDHPAYDCVYIWRWITIAVLLLRTNGSCARSASACAPHLANESFR